METLYGEYEKALELSDETFQDIFETCRPRMSAEKWTEIPWFGTLWEARQRAAAELKPLFIWAMNGHPFGCV